MKNHRKHRSAISVRLYLSVFLLLLFTILLTGFVCVRVALEIKSGDQDTAILDYAEMIAEMDEVRQLVKSETPNERLRETLDSLTAHFSTINVLVICNRDSVRLYHTNPDRVGERFVGGDEGRITAGADPYISVAVGTMGRQRRAFYGIDDEDGIRIGFVMTSVLIDNIAQVRHRIFAMFLTLFLLLLAAGGVIAGIYRVRLQKLLLGYRPEDFANLYIERVEVMDALEEGLFAIDTEGRVTVMNRAARKMLELPDSVNPEGRLLTDYYPETMLPTTVRTGITEHDVSFMIRGKHIISSRIPVRRKGKITGAVSIFRNKTEVTKLAEELTGTRYMIETLRAVNHEFTNKLHVILGLLEMNEIPEAKEYITGTSLISGQAVSDISRRVPIPSLAALLIGKLMKANEMGIRFVLKQDTFFNSKESGLPVDCFITLVGNLVENAMDELNSGDFPEKAIELGIYSEPGHTTIICDDTGGGIPEDILFSIYDPHTTTKGEGHGNGFRLMKEIVDRYEGTFHIDTEAGEGTSIEINLPV